MRLAGPPCSEHSSSLSDCPRPLLDSSLVNAEKLADAMKRSLLLVVILVGTVGSQEKKQAVLPQPRTIQDCRANQKLWLSRLEEGGTESVSFKELGRWYHEMLECQLEVDPQFRYPYFNTLSEIGATQEMRLEAFLRRHAMYEQFIAEDEQGKRH